jgi:hypothetical protein
MGASRSQELRIEVPPEMQPGVYANFLSVWHTPYEFTLDFAATQPPVESEDGPVVVPCRVVTRVKVPVTVMFDILRALNENMTRYERVFGEIRRPQPGSGGGGEGQSQGGTGEEPGPSGGRPGPVE